jgi:hypothetical protein
LVSLNHFSTIVLCFIKFRGNPSTLWNGHTRRAGGSIFPGFCWVHLSNSRPQIVSNPLVNRLWIKFLLKILG